MRTARLLGLLIPAALVIAATMSTVGSAKPMKGTVTAATIPDIPPFSPADLNAPAGKNWIAAGGDLRDWRYSTLTQINTANVANLRQAWVTNLGFKPVKSGEPQETTPMVYEGVMYVATALGNVYALDAQTGAKLWERTNGWDYGAKSVLLKINRGIALGEGKVFIGQSDGNAVALDAKTGAEIWRVKFGRFQEGYGITSPPAYFDGKVMFGITGGDLGARGFAVAVDAKTGRELWRWYVIPGPGEVGSGTWGLGEWQKGGGAIWIYSSIDPGLRLLYLVTGNPVPWNGRAPGDNLFTDSIVALNLDTGRLVWWYQTVHHDLWDWDTTNPPVLFDAVYNGVFRRGVAVASKTGWVYLLDRSNGKPLIGIREKKVPQLKGPGAAYANTAKTQPYPIGDAFVKQCSRQKDWKKKAPDGKPFRFGCIFTPYAPTKQGSFLASRPGAGGGVDWPPSAFNPQLNFLYLCAAEGAGTALGAIPRKQQRWIAGNLAVVGVNFGAGNILKPSGKIVAMNLLNNRIAWSVNWPVPCGSGMLSTAGNLVFVGRSSGHLYAYDATRGTQLWRGPKAPAAIAAPAMTYTAGGKQYVAVFAGGGLSTTGKPGTRVHAYALP
jgi:quinohemoprotein ethanol dehydrogenase